MYPPVFIGAIAIITVNCKKRESKPFWSRSFWELFVCSFSLWNRKYYNDSI